MLPSRLRRVVMGSSEFVVWVETSQLRPRQDSNRFSRAYRYGWLAAGRVVFSLVNKM